MNEYSLLIILLLISTLWFYFGNKTALSLKNKQLKLNSLPHYYGIYVALYSFIPALFSYLLILVFDGILFSNLIMEFVPKEILNSPIAQLLCAFTSVCDCGFLLHYDCVVLILVFCSL